MITIAAAGTFPDMWQGYLQGPIKALALQGKVIQYNFVAYWIINFPLAYFFVFQLGFGYKGIWMAMVVAQVFLCVSFMFMIYGTNWQKVADEASDRQS